MRFGAVSTITLLSAVAFVACVPNSSSPKEPTPGGGGSGGNASVTSSSGGAQSNGGTSSSGGSASGGTTAQGGTTVQGGAGGSSSSGGTAATTGVKLTGGTTSNGGSTGGGGLGPQGGSSAAGGASASNCTDEAPPQTPTCADWAAWNTCSADWFKNYCNRSCGRCSGGSSNGGAGGTSSRGGAGGNGGVPQGGAGGSSNSGGGGVSAPGSTNPPITGSNGFATRYWDCCKPSCSWTTNLPSCQKDGTTRISDKNAKSGCDGGGSAFECYDFSPWYDPATNMSYGFAAHNGVSCGTCFMLQFTGEGNSGQNAGATALKGQQMIVQAINIGGIDGNQFDILIPGGGVGAMNGCSTQWGSSTDLGVQYGGLLAECKGDASCMKGKCQSVFGNMPGLLAGCNWFTGWYSSADNPKVIYKQVSCPEQIKSKSNIGS